MKKACSAAVWLVLAMMTLVSGQMPSGSLYLHLPFDGNYTDASGRNKTGLPSGSPVFSADRSGNQGRAILLDGLDDHVTCNNSGDFDCTVDYSVSIWFKPDSADKPQPMCLISKNGLDGRDDCRAQFNLEIAGGDSGRLHYFMGDNILGHPHAVSIFGGKMVSHVWTHAAVTMTGDTARLYVNGVLMDSARFIGSGRVMAFNNVQVGRYSNDDAVYPVQRFQGAVDDVRLYARALTAAEVLALSAETPRAVLPADSIYTNQIGMRFKRITAGTFQMGWEGQRLAQTVSFDGMFYGLYNERPAHAVTFSSDFYMGIYEVTRHDFYPTDPSTKPVTGLSWYAADSFCRWLTANDPNGWTYRLPTEAEWEYACRAGTTTPFSTGDSINGEQGFVFCYGSYCDDMKPVGSYPPNPWGLYDMHGNAKEWCLDWYGSYTASALTDPGGYDRSEYKVWRGRNGDIFFGRSAARGAVNASAKYAGFRVVISATNLNYKTQPDTVSSYSRNIAASQPEPLVVPQGENYTDSDGRVFVRTRINRVPGRYPGQRDSVVYVSLTSIQGDSGTSRKSAGLFARNLSQRLGVLYRLSNRYELADAGLNAVRGQYHLTVLPDVKYPEGCFGHPDVSQYAFRHTPAIPIMPESLKLGYIYPDCDNEAFIEECTNGDILGCWYSGTSEDNTGQTTAGSRLRLGRTAWDTVTQVKDIPLTSDTWLDFWNDGKGNLFQYHQGLETWKGYASVSTDHGQHWSAPWNLDHVAPQKSISRMGGDTVVATADNSCFMISYDGGRTWPVQRETRDKGGFHISSALLDDGSFLVFKRGAFIKNTDSVVTQYSAVTRDLGLTWQEYPTPFYPPNIGCYNIVLKLHSGRLLFALHSDIEPWETKAGVILAESEDDGKTWFCRRKFGTYFADNDVMTGYMDMCQGKDGMIHLMGTNGTCGSGWKNENPQASFSEQWLREGSCLDVAEWGINTAGMVRSGCPDDDSMPPLAAGGSAGGVGAATRTAPTLAASPNPFNPSATILAHLPENEHAELSVFSVTGKAIRHWTLKGGEQRITWNGRDAAGKALPSGCYFLVMETSGDKLLIERMVLLK